ncbi:hypothetical protein P3T76_003848 [Phytophthora citrophthora]|uniref:Uncharacterized protein n=1 Tax=Phytophthora citrophthora TaxID=4793 RepID=A0AAD9GVF8_9STRA|nr:hypothetical protein P3T76_003848 [Phytophthora citrophthora]
MMDSASNMPQFHQFRVPRSVSTRSIMNDTPLLMLTPESDIRFQNLPALKVKILDEIFSSYRATLKSFSYAGGVV